MPTPANPNPTTIAAGMARIASGEVVRPRMSMTTMNPVA